MKIEKIHNIIFLPVFYFVNFFILIGDFVRTIFVYFWFLMIRVKNVFYQAFLNFGKWLQFKREVIVDKLTSKKLINFTPILPKQVGYKKVSIIEKIPLLQFVEKVRENISKIQFPKLILPVIPKLTISIQRITFQIPIFHYYKKIVRSLWKKVKYFLLGSIITLLIVFGIESYNFVVSLPSPQLIGTLNYSLSSHIYDRNGKLLYEIYRDQNRTPVTLKTLPNFVYQSTIAIEDKDFFNHNGISLGSGVIRAIKDMITQGGLQGGSTITQQLVKTALLTPERTIQRKIKEIILAVWTENLYSKDQILEMYLNQVPYGGSSYGIEEASKVYFGKNAKDLVIEEAALLAGLPQAPSVYSPFSNPEFAKKRRNDVLRAMYTQGYINKETLNDKLQTELNVIPPKTSIKAPHFVFYVKSQLENQFGISKVEEGGMKVTTTLDFEIQEQTETILLEELEKIKNLNVTNGAVLVTKPATGEILAMVGSIDFFAEPSGAFNVTTALRQPGSSIKPIMYSLALQKGYTAASIIDDSPTIFTISQSEVYKPVNYDGKFHGKVPLRYALANSYNIPAVKVLNSIGLNNFLDFSSKMGISTWNDRTRFGLSIALGGGEVTMIDMAKAFGVLANQGYKVPLSYFLKIENANGTLVDEINPFKIREMDEGASFIISDILSDNFARQMAFGPRTALEIPGYKVAVKTGTTNDKKDNWTIGYTPDFLVAVWVGNNNNQPMNPYLSSGITGAAPIWNRTMSYLLNKYSMNKSWFTQPDNIIEKTCYFGRKEFFIKGTEKTASCTDSLFGATPTPTKTP